MNDRSLLGGNIYYVMGRLIYRFSKIIKGSRK